MKVYHISSAPFSGGAARAGFRLHEGLLQQPGVESTWLDCSQGARGAGVIAVKYPAKPQSLSKRIRRRHWESMVSSYFAPTTAPASNPIGWGSIEVLKKLPVPDVWNLHWVSWFLDWETMLPWMAERAPIVWTLHDLNPLKGLWHYEPLPEECTIKRMALEAKAVELKRRALAKVPRERLTFVGPSRWMVEACRKSPVTKGFSIQHIPYGLDTEVFSPRDPSVFRKICGIPQAAVVLGFIADNLRDPRKGMASLQQALAELAVTHPGAHLITVGNGKIDSGGLPHSHLGPIHSDLLLSYFYSACDVFLCPSLQDNLPNTVLEAMATGTPAIGYNTGGIPDMIDNDSGRLAVNVGDSASLLDAIHGLLADRSFSRDSIRQQAVSCYRLAGQAEQYRKVYQDIGRPSSQLSPTSSAPAAP